MRFFILRFSIFTHSRYCFFLFLPAFLGVGGNMTDCAVVGEVAATASFAFGVKISAQRFRGRDFFLSALGFGAGAAGALEAGAGVGFAGVILPVGSKGVRPSSQARRTFKFLRPGSLGKVIRNLTRRGAFCLINHTGGRKFFHRPLYRLFRQRRYGLRRRGFLQRARALRRKRRVRTVPRRIARHVRFQYCIRRRRGVATSFPLRAIFSKLAGATRRLIRRIVWR